MVCTAASQLITWAGLLLALDQSLGSNIFRQFIFYPLSSPLISRGNFTVSDRHFSISARWVIGNLVYQLFNHFNKGFHLVYPSFDQNPCVVNLVCQSMDPVPEIQRNRVGRETANQRLITEEKNPGIRGSGPRRGPRTEDLRNCSKNPRIRRTVGSGPRRGQVWTEGVRKRPGYVAVLDGWINNRLVIHKSCPRTPTPTTTPTTTTTAPNASNSS